VTSDSVARLVELAERATPGPWRTLAIIPPPTIEIQRPYPGGAPTPIGRVWAPEDAALITVMRDELVPLCREVEDQRKQLKSANEQIVEAAAIIHLLRHVLTNPSSPLASRVRTASTPGELLDLAEEGGLT